MEGEEAIFYASALYKNTGRFVPLCMFSRKINETIEIETNVHPILNVRYYSVKLSRQA